MIIGKKLSKVFDILGEILATLTIILIAFLYINGKYNFYNDQNMLELLFKIREYMILGTVVVVGLEFSVKRNILWFLIFCALAAVAVIFSFFPEVINQFLPATI
jgi:ethanolamine transporter EutH